MYGVLVAEVLIALFFGYHVFIPWKDVVLPVGVNISTSRVAGTVSDKFLSVTLDTTLIRGNWFNMDLSSPKVLKLAKHLNPVYVRVGGSLQDFLYFNDMPAKLNYTKKKKADLKPFNVTKTQLRQLFSFTANADWNVIFGLNMLNRNSVAWKPENALKMLDYFDKKGYKLAGLGLGNEPDVYNLILKQRPDPMIMGRDFQHLRSLMRGIPSLHNALLLGPDVTNMCVLYPLYKKFFSRYLDAAHTALDAVTIHHYYIDGRMATLENFYDPYLMNKLEDVLLSARKMLRSHAPDKNIWIGETSAAWDSGSENMTDSFVGGFMWLDKLGLAAKYNVQVVMRQSFYGGNYGLIDFKTLDPNPDYWLSVIYKKLVDPRVLDVAVMEERRYARVYAHCTNQKKTGYPPGSVTVFALNVFPTMDVNLTFFDLTNMVVHIFHLTPAGPLGLRSKTVALNGTPLKLLGDNSLPEFTPQIQTTPVILPKLTFAFYVFPNAKAEACM